MTAEIERLLQDATELQLRWIAARVRHRHMCDAAAALGMDRTTPNHWPNLDQLNAAVRLILLERVKALTTHHNSTTFNKLAEIDS